MDYSKKNRMIAINCSIGHKEKLFQVDKLFLESGKVYSLIGKNGSGKSTLIKSIVGLIPVLNGEILLNNQRISGLRRIDRSRLISAVHSKSYHEEFISVQELVQLGRAPYTNIFNRLTKLDNQIVERSLEMFNLTAISTKFIGEISDGERQLADLARCIAQETRIIILDEPTSSLDYANKTKIFDLLKSISLDLNKLIILSSHDIDLSIEFSDQIIGIDTINQELKIYNPLFSKQEIVYHIF
jgi:iron complex transport system ATP-binding protein